MHSGTTILQDLTGSQHANIRLSRLQPQAMNNNELNLEAHHLHFPLIIKLLNLMTCSKKGLM